MALTDEEIKELRKQLSEQIKGLPEEQRVTAQEHIDSMSPEALETMLNQQRSQGGKSIFRMIVAGEVDSVKVGENSHALAVLDINPISRGHTIVIPKEATADKAKVSSGVYDLSKEISKKLIDNLGAKSTRVETSAQFGEVVLHVIPIYDSDLTLDSSRSKADISELENVRKSFEVIKVDKAPEKVIKKRKPRLPVRKLNRRIP